MSAWTRVAALAATAAAAAGLQAWRRSRETKQTWAAATDSLPEDSGTLGTHN